MIAACRTIAIRLALCLSISWLVWRTSGPSSLPLTLALYGVALARPLIDLASAIRHEMRRATWHELEGRHFVFKGRPVRVVEGDDRQRWVRLADVRAVVGTTASDGALRITYPAGWRLLGRPSEPYLADEALLAHLGKERSPVATRFRQWVGREIVFPARRQRERFGFRPDATEDRPAS
ncbi:MAG: hypothetical protein ABI641_05425 [Caldimonas sp.]